MAEAALRIHQRTIEAKNIWLIKDLPDKLVAEVDTCAMLQVMSNLIVNALDAMPSAGTLCLRLRKCEREVRLVIADKCSRHPGETYRCDISPPRANRAPGWPGHLEENY